MNNQTPVEQRLKDAIAAIQERDPRLAQEIQDEVRPAANERVQREAESRRNRRLNEGRAGAALEGGQDRRRLITPETIVLRTGRPVLAVKNDQAELSFRDEESKVWRERLKKAKDQIHRAVLASGRVEVRSHPTFDWLGTGWLVREDVVVTNRHVAQEFGRRLGTQFTFRQGTLGRTMSASLDFLEEAGRREDRTFKLVAILHIEGDNGPDMAFLKVEPVAGRPLAAPIGLSTHAPIEKQQVAAIGYPARDSRIPEQDLMEDIFGDVFEKKRLAPGQVIRVANRELLHDCSTLGGNSGSVVLDLESGEAVGLHFAGKFLVANFAVPAVIVKERLDQITSGASVSVAGTIDADDWPAAVDAGSPDDDDEVIETEARADDYRDREGYQPEFLGHGLHVAVPSVVRNPDDVLRFEFNGKTRTLLDYEHFSVMMGQSRRMCIFSAVNIDGTSPHKGKRPGWRSDPRIPQSAQVISGPYGNAPKFARGHMTRREDPMWGDAVTGQRGNADSMHLTNAVPQMQPFNAGIWLGLESYALENARQDEMRVCVFTGPVFRPNDPIRFGIAIPVTFWKVIAFIHDDTGELCATGYLMSQKAFLQEEEFVFGAHETAQSTLTAIEGMTGLSFGDLTKLDPLVEEGLEAPARRLTDFRQIRFK
jgi:endonuclease G